MENNIALSKQQAADFVNDALAMEIKIHSLHELASKLRAKASKINSDASYKWTQVEKKYRTEGGMSAQEFKIQSELNEVNTKIKKENSKLDEEIKYEMRMLGYGSVIISAVVTVIIAALLCSIGAVLLEGVISAANPTFGERLANSNLLMAFAMPIALIAMFVAIKISNDKLKKKATKRAKATISKNIGSLQARAKNLEEQLKNPQLVNSRITPEKLEIVKRDCAKDRKNAQDLFDEANQCDMKAYEIKEILDQCYEKSGIVPPDYRYVDCLVVVQHAFKNGLADSMKEAILYYEQKEFRNQVIRGVNNIHEMLGQLASSMLEVKGILSSIDSNVHGIMRNQEISNNIQSARMYADKEFYEAQIAHNKWVEKTFSSYEY
jgi:hypothetical protein